MVNATTKLLGSGVAISLAFIPASSLLIKNNYFRIHASSATYSTTPFQAARFLSQSTFGPTEGSIADVQSSGYADWIKSQESLPISQSHLQYVEQRLAAQKILTPSYTLKPSDFYFSFWNSSITAPDQLRQRVKFALGQIFVVSLVGKSVDVRGMSSYYDMLGQNAFGNYRTLIENVTLHPMMGLYLTYRGNKKEDPLTGRHPDENYAREIMQLMSIGLYELNQDGSYKLDTNGNPIKTYGPDDIHGLSKVFTGLTWYTQKGQNTGGVLFPDSLSPVTPMVFKNDFHSTSSKSFLGVNIPASVQPDTARDLKIALDTIFNHPNVGPFISRQLIQRLVTSNPSPGYIYRVAGVFNDNGSGVRGDMGAVVAAILTDPEARDDTTASASDYGKLREPVLRVTHWARAFSAVSATGDWMIGDTSAPDALAQTPQTSPSVFNFWRPGYTPPGTNIIARGLVAPEYQVVDEVSVAGYSNYMLSTIDSGLGYPPTGSTKPDIHSDYTNELALADNPNALIDRINLLILSGQISDKLRGKIYSAITSISIAGSKLTPAQISTAKLNRVKLAIYMAFMSPEYLAQR